MGVEPNTRSNASNDPTSDHPKSPRIAATFRAALRVPRLADMATKMVWGTDWPSPGVNSPRKNVEDFLALGFGDEVNRRVLRENAEALFAV